MRNPLEEAKPYLDELELAGYFVRRRDSIGDERKFWSPGCLAIVEREGGIPGCYYHRPACELYYDRGWHVMMIINGSVSTREFGSAETAVGRIARWLRKNE